MLPAATLLVVKFAPPALLRNTNIIYSLPVVKEIAKEKICNFYIVANKPMEQKYLNHPSGKFYLDERVIKMLLRFVKTYTL